MRALGWIARGLLLGSLLSMPGGLAAQSPSPLAAGAPPVVVPEVVQAPQAQLGHRPMAALTLNINLPAGALPQNRATPELMSGLALPRGDWTQLCYYWDAPAICYRPLLFEEENVERYGYTVPCPTVLQPVVSCGRFFVSVPMIPYNIAAHDCCDCIYDLGHGRPGSCVPYRCHYPPLSLKGGLVEAAVVTGVVLAVP